MFEWSLKFSDFLQLLKDSYSLMEQLESETGCKASLLGHCNVIGCTNGRRQICDLEAENCEVHEGRLNEFMFHCHFLDNQIKQIYIN